MSEEQAMSGTAIYNVFFERGEVRPDFRKEYISLWSGWLGKERLHLLDEVSEEDWSRFNRMLLAVFGAFRTGVVDHSAETVEFPTHLEPLLNDHQESMRKGREPVFSVRHPGIGLHDHRRVGLHLHSLAPEHRRTGSDQAAPVRRKAGTLF